MEQLFGDYLIKCKVEHFEPEKKKEPAPAEEGKDGEQADPDASAVNEDAGEAKLYAYEKISVDDAMVRT